MKKLCAFYFSGTGNTRYVTLALCRKLSGAFDVRVFDIASGENLSEEFERADCVLLAFPIYGSSPPMPMRRFAAAQAKRFAGKEVIVVITQYLFSGDGAASLGRTVERYGGRVTFAEHFRMPDNLADISLLKVRNGSELNSIMRRTDRRIDRFARRIIEGRALRRGFNPISHAVGYFCQRALWRKHENQKKSALKIDGASCVGCGVCAKNCPVGNIRIERGKALPRGECALCYRCVNLCPRRAITLVGSRPPICQYKGPPENADT